MSSASCSYARVPACPSSSSSSSADAAAAKWYVAPKWASQCWSWGDYIIDSVIGEAEDVNEWIRIN